MTSKKNFTVYKSSAGSGKTYTLVREYLSLALKYKHADDLKHILAITFTNKAAAEMKERIVSMLHAFSTGNLSGSAAQMFADIQSVNQVSAAELQSKAQASLNYILHHYSDFAVSTIDKFNHKIIRSFAFDLKLPVNFDLETDINGVLQEAVDELLAQSGKNEKLTKVLITYIEDLLEDEKSWNISKELMQFGKQLFNEDIAKKIDALKSLDLETFLQINKKINAYNESYKQGMMALGKDGLDLIVANSIEHSELAGGERSGIGKFFTYLHEFRVDKLNASDSVRKSFSNKKFAAQKKMPAAKIQLIDSLALDFTAIFNRYEKLFDANHERFLIYRLIKSNLFSVAVLNELEKIVVEQKERKNILFISEFNKIISDAIANEPAPYIYEKLGERYRHFLIDEFQDTSVMQWRNLLPLVHNSLSQGFFNMIVGDTKQSIYRWRNGEVEQFASLPEVFSTEEKSVTLLEQEESLVHNYDYKNLAFNFRSKENIIRFNNDFFQHLSVSGKFNFSRIYSDSVQLVADDKDGGSVHIGIFDDDKSLLHDWMLDRVFDIVQLCLKKNYSRKDIAIITRSNHDGAAIAAFLMDKQVDVISKESLLLGSSAEVRFIIELIRFIDNPSNQVSIAAIRYYLIQHLNYAATDAHEQNHAAALLEFLKTNHTDFYIDYFRSLPLFELCTELSVQFGLSKTPNVYLKFFLDHIFAFGQHHSAPADLLVWWENKGQNLSIIVPDGVDAVNVMTIHKSKGLQFPIVILPYADLHIKNSGIKHWCGINEPAFPELKYALLNHGTAMESTPYAAVYQKEAEKIMLDQLNMLYVAFTRPEDHLFVLSGNRQNSMHTHIAGYIEKSNMPLIELAGHHYYSNGELHEAKRKSDTHAQQPANTIASDNTTWRTLLKTSGFNTHNKEQEAQLQYGSMIHTLLSYINHPSDIDKVIDKHRSTIEKQALDVNEIKNKLAAVFSLHELNNYFDGSYTIKKEASILNKQGELLRPDVVAVKGDTAVIIDYKTGEPRTAYAEQLSSYAALIAAMGYKVERQLIVYVDTPEISYV